MSLFVNPNWYIFINDSIVFGRVPIQMNGISQEQAYDVMLNKQHSETLAYICIP